MVVRKLTPLVTGALWLAACGDLSGDYSVVPSWLINGIAPTKADCEAFGVERVRFRVEKKGADRVLEAECDEGILFEDGDSYGGFITTQSFDFGRNYKYAVEMLDARDRVVASASGSFRAYWDDVLPLFLAPVEILEPAGDIASYSGSWTIAGGLAAGCEELGIDRVAIWVTSRTDFDFERAFLLDEAPCSQGEIVGGPALTYGHYYFKYVALDANDDIVDESEVFSALVEEESEIVLDPVRFDGV